MSRLTAVLLSEALEELDGVKRENEQLMATVRELVLLIGQYADIFALVNEQFPSEERAA